MATDVSSFKKAYKTPIQADFPQTAKLVLGDREYTFRSVPYALRYGTNPHQPFAAYAPDWNPNLSIGRLNMLKGGKGGLSLTNLQDMSQAIHVLKYFDKPACTVMKHLNPSGFSVDDEFILELRQEPYKSLADTYRIARGCDERSAFGSVVGFNRKVDKAAAEAVMETFVEGVIAPAYDEDAIEVFKRTEGTGKLNNSIRIAQADNMDKVPKFIGDNVDGLYNIRNLADGTLTFEVPYLTRIRSAKDFITDPMIPNIKPERNNGQDYVALTKPTEQQLRDGLTSWYVNINVRSNGIVFVKDGAAIAVGTGQQERVGAVEQAIEKAIQKGHNLEGSVMSSDAFFPFRDSIDTIAKYGVGGVVWPAGSTNDADVIQAANEHKMALMVTLERCFLHI